MKFCFAVTEICLSTSFILYSNKILAMPYRFDIYIGSDNTTRKVSRDYLEKLKKWASKAFPDGYTILKGKGFYNGSSEDSLILTILSPVDLPLKGQLEPLKQELGQEAILLAKSYVELEVF